MFESIGGEQSHHCSKNHSMLCLIHSHGNIYVYIGTNDPTCQFYPHPIGRLGLLKKMTELCQNYLLYILLLYY